MFFRAIAIFAVLTLPLMSMAQSTVTATLAWDHVGGADAFYLERKLGQAGTYAPVPVTIAGTDRQVTDTTVPTGQIVCYRLKAGLQEFRSLPSNEVCHAVLSAPINLHIQ